MRSSQCSHLVRPIPTPSTLFLGRICFPQGSCRKHGIHQALRQCWCGTVQRGPFASSFRFKHQASKNELASLWLGLVGPGIGLGSGPGIGLGPGPGAGLGSGLGIGLGSGRGGCCNVMISVPSLIVQRWIKLVNQFLFNVPPPCHRTFPHHMDVCGSMTLSRWPFTMTGQPVTK